MNNKLLTNSMFILDKENCVVSNIQWRKTMNIHGIAINNDLRIRR